MLRTLALLLMAGVCSPAATLLDQNFDSVTLPNLPSGWFSFTASGSASGWETNGSCGTVNGISVCASALTESASTDVLLAGPLLMVDLYPVTITFSSRGAFGRFNLTGGVLEVSQGGGPFQDFLKVGTFTQNGYNGTLDSSATANPLHDGNTGNSQRSFWTDSMNQAVMGVIASGSANSFLQFRWRLGSTAGGASWAIDDVLVTSASTNAVPEPGTLGLAGAALAVVLAARKRG